MQFVPRASAGILSNSSFASGFGSNTGNAFGSNNNTTGGGMFGGNTTSTFGSGGGFGATNNNNNTTSAFGSKPFGSSTTGGGLFGGSGATGGSTFGGFGSANNNTTSGFGGGASTGSGLFGGGNKPAFGAGSTTNTGGGIFGGGGGSTGGFGSNNTSGGFGSGTSGGFGTAAPTNNGTASTPFQAHTEKDGTSATQHYQTITFQQPYQNFSLEELRLADYNQGRRYGNSNGQGGAFGQSSTFGGFGANNNTANTTSAFGSNNTNTGGGLFGGGSTTNTTGGFGQSTGGFGTNNNTNTGGGLFGAKPATGGLFGGSNTTSTGTTGGGLFGGGSTTNTTGGFGSGGGFGAANNSNTGGGLFGGNNSAAKPAFGAGATNTSTGFGGSTNTGFGQSNTGGGLFGQNNQASAAPAFGGAATTASSGGGLFGNAGGSAFGQNNATQAPASGGLFGGGGGFGQNNNQAKPATGGLFGGGSTTTNTGGGLFGGGASTTTPSSGGLFGGSTANNTGGGLFGGAKPATTGGGLFGGASTTNTGNATGGGLFGNLGGQSNQGNAGSSLFGGQNNQQKPGGLFGNSATTTNTGGGLFGSMGQNNQQQNGLGGSLFGASQNNQQQNQQQNGNSLFGASGSSLLNTSLNTNPYGNDALFAGLATPTQSPGPIATPLSSSQKNKKSAILPQHKLNPAASTRLLTPQAKRTGGYGFTYSTYGSPASGQATPNLGGSLFAGGNLTRSLGSRSTSISNLRNSFTPETSILAPGAFSTTGRSFGNGSLKKLNVNRSINTRIPLFDEPPHKRVSFAGGDGDTLNGSANAETAMVVRRDDGDASPRSVNGDASPEPSRPAMQQVNGNELARVPENDSVLTPKSPSAVNAQPSEDPEPGEYWSQPSVQQLKKLSKQELKNVRNFVVGRHNIGQIEFHQGAPVDLSETNLDKLFGDIVQLNHRNATVYGENCTCLPKPPMGTALNHPSRVTLLNSWPRNKAGKKDAKHLERLKRVAGTTFESYNASNGGWVFTVPHFSSYGLDYENDYSDDEDESSELSPAPDTPAHTMLNTSQMTSTPQQDSLVSPDGSSPDDTFDFKRGMRSRVSVPGGFGDQSAYEDYDDEENFRDESFLGERSVGSLDSQQEADYYESESELDQDQSMADSVSRPVHTTEPAAATDSDPFRSTLKAPKSILKASQVFKPNFGTPSKGQAIFDDNWADQLQRTISPRKQDRNILRESQGHALREHDRSPTFFAAQSINTRPFATHMDLMNSLFGETGHHRDSLSKRQGHGIELPYSKRPKSSHDFDEMTDSDRDFHNSSKPRFSENGVLVYGNKGSESLESGAFSSAQEPLVGATKDVRFLKMPTFDDAAPETLSVQKQQTKISTANGIPFATIITEPAPIEFSSMAKAVAVDTAAGVHEQHAWQLLSLLFDGADRIKKPADVDAEHMERYRKDRLSEFWKALVYGDAQKHAQEAATSEERAIAQLSCNNIAEACHALLEGLDLRLATMIAQIGGDASMRQIVTTQIEEWRRLDMLAEMEDAQRALYELLSGNCAQAAGKQGNGRENRACTFNISSRFALDWRRAFGLRLWYGTLVDEPIELAVAQFADAIRDGLEDVKPVPWFVRDNIDMGWTDPDAANREDLLWGILKLYAASKLDIPANVEDVLAPENVSGHPLNARLSFQLFQLFYSRHRDEIEEPERKIGMPAIRGDGEGDFRRSFMSSTATVTNGDTQSADPLVELGDKITLSYASSLHTQEHWTTAVWVYTHLSSAAMREHYIRSVVNSFAKSVTLDDSDSTYAYLTNGLQVPATWLHAAAALQAKTEGDAVREATHLIKANELEEAHEVLCRKVGPDAIISRDYEPLRELMAGFVPEETDGLSNDNASLASSRRTVSGHGDPIAGWAQGGQIYLDYIELLDHTGRRSTYRVDEELEQEIQHLLFKLQKALQIAARDRLESCGLEERVALMEIAGTVANLVAKSKTAQLSQILKLPLTEDLWLKHSCNLSASYYRNLMADSR
ncbi:nucleoporin nup189 [Stagonosporopsis vannaccii]|nr:nucleoporin nup189 [Stagonosporopsis vannaccii]